MTPPTPRVALGLLAAAAIAWGTPAEAQMISGRTLPAAAEDVLREVLLEAGLSGARVTSVARTPRRQAELMLGAIRRDGVAAVCNVYDPESHSVIDAYESAADSDSSDAEIVALMEAAVLEVIEELGEDRRTMMHVASSRHTFDVAPSSITDPNAFEAALRAHPRVLRVIPPQPGEAAFHIEVAKGG